MKTDLLKIEKMKLRDIGSKIVRATKASVTPPKFRDISRKGSRCFLRRGPCGKLRTCGRSRRVNLRMGDGDFIELLRECREQYARPGRTKASESARPQEHTRVREAGVPLPGQRGRHPSSKSTAPNPLKYVVRASRERNPCQPSPAIAAARLRRARFRRRSRDSASAFLGASGW